MTSLDLSTPDGLRAACEVAAPTTPARWIDEVAQTIERVRAANVATRATREFQQFLWEDNHISAVGQGNIYLGPVLDDAAFREWLAERSVQQLPVDFSARTGYLQGLVSDTEDRLRALLPGGAIPWLKIFRVLCALYPETMTSIASRSKLVSVAQAMGIDADDSVVRHVAIRSRFDEALGAAPDNPRDLAKRVTLPWMVFQNFVNQPDSAPSEQPPVAVSPVQTVERVAPVPGEKLEPWEPARRRRGFSAAKGLFPALLATLEFLRDGATRAELLEFIRSLSPDSKVAYLGTIINCYEAEFGAITRHLNRYVLTDAGQLTLERQDPTPISDWVLQRILGADLALIELRERGPIASGALATAIRKANPGWTTNFVPNTIVSWFRSMGLIETAGGKNQLTARGRAWADRITWTPEVLPSVEPVEGELTLPPLGEVTQSVLQTGLHFDKALVAKLHAGLWANSLRHFAILTGLSGAGKTLLARKYATALAGGAEDEQLVTIPVQPGWYDPGPLLGYVNPMRSDSYVKQDFLMFLLAAAADPTRPYVAVLDEMNLSHPEQFLAPLLSAMETGAPIGLHAGEDEIDGIPPSIRYPSNLAIIGTVNMDETTHGLSDKVLDRAFVLEFWDVDLGAYTGWDKSGLGTTENTVVRELLDDLMAALRPARLHFGWRVVDDVVDFLHEAVPTGALKFKQALDAAIYAKVLPKLRGEDSPKFRRALEVCAQTLTKCELHDSRRKVEELTADLIATGSARFWR